MNEKEQSTSQADAGVNPRSNVALVWLRGIVGAVVGGVAGWYLLWWLLSFGLLGLVIPSAFIGIGFGLASRRTMPVAGIVCGIAGLIFGLYCDHATNVNGPDDTFIGYLAQLQNVSPINLIMIGVGTLIAYWFGKGR